VAKFVLTEVRKGEKPDAHNNAVYFVDGTGEDGTQFESAYLAQKPDRDPPQAGSVLEGYDLSKSDKGYRLKRTPQQQGGGGFSGGKRDPAERASIVRQHSQEMALRYVEIKAALGTVEKDFKPDDLKPIVDWFVQDAGS
jgi:hypothetical protein